MVAFSRQFLFMLIVLLQSAAPLVHAHIGGNVSLVAGLHLHEFEELHQAAKSLSWAKSSHAVDAETCIVDVDSAIKQQQKSDNHAPVLYLPSHNSGFAVVRNAKVVDFSPHVAGFVSEPFLSHNNPRAPPTF